MFTYYPKGVCSTKYEIDIEKGVIRSIRIENGCRGNTQGMARLLTGMKMDDAIEKLSGIQCRGTSSCPDQIARALVKYKNENP